MKARLAHRRPPRSTPARPDRDHRERGLSVVMVALMLVPMLIITALVVDVGVAKQRRRQVQSAADAAALAAAAKLGDSPEAAIREAKDWAAKNLEGLELDDWKNCLDPGALPGAHDSANNNQCISFDSASAPTKVRVRIPVEAQPRFFAQFATDGYLQVTAHAVAARTPGAAPSTTAGPCGLCIISGEKLQMSNNVDIAVTGGAIQADRITINLQDNNLNVTPVPIGWYDKNENSNWGMNYRPGDPAYAFAARYQKLAAPVPNPFAALTVSYAGLASSNANLTLPSGSTTLAPDTIYREAVTIKNGTLTLQPNRTYYFNNTLNIDSGATLVGVGVTLVFGCQSNCEGGKLNVHAGGTLQITAPTSGPYAGMAIMFDPTARGSGNNFNGTLQLDGAVYMKQAGFATGDKTKISAWTIVSGSEARINGGTIRIDNTRYDSGGGGSAGGGSTAGEISLVE